MNGKLIVIEGIDGSGKTTVWHNAKEKLQGERRLWLHDPGDTRLGNCLRKILLDPEMDKPFPMAREAELFLYLASRAQLVLERILPALSEGLTVVLDRYWLSTLAYQGVNLTIPKSSLRELVSIGTREAHWPSLMVWLDVSAETAEIRLRKRYEEQGIGLDRIESRGIDYLRRIRERYEEELAIVESEKQSSVARISGEESVDSVTQAVVEAIRESENHI